MPGTQTESGKAFEYACLMSIVDFLKDVSIKIVEDKPFITARRSFDALNEDVQLQMRLAARAAIRMIYILEPRLEHGSANSVLTLSIQPDSQGISGDVRDVVCVRSSDNWEIGLSCKHNHDAVKHCRLSDSIDFGEKWLQFPCSTTYFDEIRPVFQQLSRLKSESSGRALWSSIDDKAATIYQPILKAFLKEFKRIVNAQNNAPANLIQYLIGKKDFYKVITDDAHRITKIQAVNICGTLNRSFNGFHSITSIPLLKLPDRVFHADFVSDSDNSIEIICNEGWNIRMRIHNASSRIESSLKFDVRLIAMPSSIFTQMEPWSIVDGYKAKEYLDNTSWQ